MLHYWLSALGTAQDIPNWKDSYCCCCGCLLMLCDKLGLHTMPGHVLQLGNMQTGYDIDNSGQS